MQQPGERGLLHAREGKPDGSPWSQREPSLPGGGALSEGLTPQGGLEAARKCVGSEDPLGGKEKQSRGGDGDISHRGLWLGFHHRRDVGSDVNAGGMPRWPWCPLLQLMI